MTISKDRVKPSPQPDSWKLKEIFGTGIVLGGYMALMTVLFFWAVKDTNFFSVRILQTYIYIYICIISGSLNTAILIFLTILLLQ